MDNLTGAEGKIKGNKIASTSQVAPSVLGSSKKKYVMPIPPGKPRQAQKSVNELKRIRQKEKNINAAVLKASAIAEKHHRQNIKKPPKTYGPYGGPVVKKPGLVGSAEEWTKWYMSEEPGDASSRPSTGMTMNNSSVRPLTGATNLSSNSDRPNSRMTDVYGRPLTADVMTDMYGRPLTAATFRPTTSESGYRPTSSDVYDIYGRTQTSDMYAGGRPKTSDTYIGVGILENEEEEDDGIEAQNVHDFVRTNKDLICHVAEEERPYTAETIKKLNDPSRFVYQNFDPSVKPPITPYPKRPLTVEEKNNRPKTLANQSLEQKMNAEEPWLIDIRGTIPIPKTAAKQTARSTPDKRAPMTRPKTVQLGRIPLQKKAKSKKESNQLDIQEVLKQAAKKRPYTVSQDSREGHAITYKESVTELGSHLTARQTIIAQADLQVEQSIRDYETWERDIVDLKWAKDKVKGWGTMVRT